MELGSIHEHVSEIIVHPEWRVNADKYDADIAMISLRNSVVFNSLIQPVCLPQDSIISEFDKGTVVSQLEAKAYVGINYLQTFHRLVGVEVNTKQYMKVFQDKST